MQVLLMFAVPVVIRGGPNWAEWITAVATVFLAGGVIVAAAQLRDTRQTRAAQTAAEFTRRWESDELRASRRESDQYETDIALRNGVAYAEEDQRSLLLRELGFWEDMAIAEQQGGLSLRRIELAMKDLALDRWALWTPTIQYLREQSPTKPIYANFERLVDQLNGQRLNSSRLLRRWIVKQLDY
jgi:hypothetical protein